MYYFFSQLAKYLVVAISAFAISFRTILLTSDTFYVFSFTQVASIYWFIYDKNINTFYPYYLGITRKLCRNYNLISHYFDIIIS